MSDNRSSRNLNDQVWSHQLSFIYKYPVQSAGKRKEDFGAKHEVARNLFKNDYIYNKDNGMIGWARINY